MQNPSCFTAPSGKFIRYREGLLAMMQPSSVSSASKRAAYELSLMENSRFVSIEGVVHHCHISGPADALETVVLIHGWDCWWMWWHHIIKSLNDEGIRTVAYDLRGHGWSEGDERGDYRIARFGRDFDLLIQKLGLSRFHIAAFSFGPFIALDYAGRHSGTVVSMTFFNFGYLSNNDFVEQFAPAVITFLFNGLLRKLTWWLPVYIFARLALSRNTVLKQDIVIGFSGLELCAPQAIEQTTRQITSAEVTSSLPAKVASIEVPMLFAAGEGDAIMTCKDAEKLAGYAKHGRFVCVPECGHLITLELPDTATALILDQMQAAGSRPGGS